MNGMIRSVFFILILINLNVPGSINFIGELYCVIATIGIDIIVSTIILLSSLFITLF